MRKNDKYKIVTGHSGVNCWSSLSNSDRIFTVWLGYEDGKPYTRISVNGLAALLKDEIQVVIEGKHSLSEGDCFNILLQKGYKVHTIINKLTDKAYQEGLTDGKRELQEDIRNLLSF